MSTGNYRIIGVCPNCSGTRIGFRRAQLPWFCPDCRIVFRTPRRVRIDVRGHPERYFLAEEVERLERSLAGPPPAGPPPRHRVQRSPATGTGLNFPELGLTGFSPKGCLIVVVIAAIAVLVGVVVANMNGNSDSDISRENEPTSTRTIPAIPLRNLHPAQRHHEFKAYMLELINEERVKAGVPPVTLGDNIAAQLHAENSLTNCFGSHWGIDGLKPYMRYSLAGGYQTNAENGSGSDYCIREGEGYRPLGSMEAEIRETMDGWMDSPGHRRTLLDRWHKKVNIGLAWNKYNFAAAQHFEGDYVEFDRLPTIDNGVLLLAGQVKNGASFDQDDYIDINVYYDPPPHALTRGQLSRTYCYDSGLPVAYVRKPLSGGWFYNNDEISTQHDPCPDPYSVAANAPPPASHNEAHEFWQRAYDDSQSRPEITVWMQAVTASEWKTSGNSFNITADLSKILDAHGGGVYTVLVWGNFGGENEVISQYSIFYGVEPPNTYNPDRWK